MAFKLLKRGNKGKMEAQEIVVPASTSLAAQVSRNEEAHREENSIIKARVSERERQTNKQTDRELQVSFVSIQQLTSPNLFPCTCNT